MSEEKWEKQVMKKIRFMTNLIWDGINLTDVDAFLENFGTNRIVGIALLDMLIYYSLEQEQSVVENLIRLLNRDLWLHNNEEGQAQSTTKIKAELQNIYENMCFIPVKDHDPSDSAFNLSAMYKKSEHMPKEIEFIDVADVALYIAKKKKFFVFYDDIIGTGTQFRTFWNETKRFAETDEKSLTLREIFEINSDVRTYYLVFGAYKNSIDVLTRDFSGLKIIASEIFTSDYRVFDDANEYWEFNKDKKELVQDFIKKKEKELKSKSEFSLSLPVLFQHSRAMNTTLSLYWFGEQGKWKELYRR